MTKTCSKCNIEKPVDQFYKVSQWKLKHGVDYYCKACRNKVHTESVKNNKRKCTIEGCTRPHYAKGVCHPHYEKAKRDRKKLENLKTFHDIFVDPDNKRKEW